MMRVPIRSETDAFHAVLAVAAVVAISTLIYYEVAPLAALAVFVALIATGLLATVIAGRRASPLHAAEAAGERSPAKRRALLIATATPTATEVRRVLRELQQRSGFADESELEIHAPVLASRTHFVTTDIDRETEQARRRLKGALAAARTTGIHARGEVGDPVDPFTGVEDELRRCHSDVIVITNSDAAQRSWIADALVHRLHDELDTPVIDLTVGGEPVMTSAPHLSEPVARDSMPRPPAHRDFMLRAEVKRIVLTLEMRGPLRREVLPRECSASHWHPGELNAALGVAIREGRVRELPFGFLAAARTPTQTRPTHARGPDATKARGRRTKGRMRSRRHLEPSRSTHPRRPTQAGATAPCAGVGMPRHASALAGLPQGTREALPVALILAAIAVPIGLLALSTLGDAALLLGLAIAAMVLITAALVIVVRRLTAEPAREEQGAVDRRHGAHPREPRPQSGREAERTGGLLEGEGSRERRHRPAKPAAVAASRGAPREGS
jgi:hypothetical protein